MTYQHTVYLALAVLTVATVLSLLYTLNHGSTGDRPRGMP